MSEPRGPWMPPIPVFLQRLFDSVPLVTYAPNDLPHRAPALSRLPTLYVFAREGDSDSGFPSFNPSCLKWQLFLKLAGVRVNVVPSSNHASPTGSLPFLLAPRTNHLQATDVIAASRLPVYAQRHGHRKVPIPGPTAGKRLDAYQALLQGPLRKAYLHALYVDPAGATLLDELYVTPASSAVPIQAALRRQLQHAAAAEILRATPGAEAAAIDAAQLYAEARDALAALETLLRASTTDWFWNAEAPTLFDAGVFAYTGLLVSEAPHALWPLGRAKPAALQDAIEAAGVVRLQEHQARLWDMLQDDRVSPESDELNHLAEKP